MTVSQIPDQLFRDLLEQNTIGIVVTDRQGCIVYANPRQLQASGYRLDELLGKTPRVFSSGETPREVYQELWTTILAGRVWHGQLTNRRKNGELRQELLRISPIRNAEGDITHFFAVKEEDLLGGAARLLGGALATVDPLTGLPNRAMLQERLANRLREREDAGLALFAIDIDHFRAIHESFGHFAADELLNRIAVRLKETVRQSDMVARSGANEFLLLLDSEQAAPQLEDLGRRLLATIATPIEIRGRSAQVTASIGIARYPLDARDPEQLMRHADEAMLSAKEHGGDELRFHAPPADRQPLEWADLTAALRDVVNRNELLLHYQPKVDLRSGRIAACRPFPSA